MWRLPDWDIEIAASAYLLSTTVNIAKYTDMNNGMLAALDKSAADLICGRLSACDPAIHGVIACKMETLQVELARHKDHTKRLNSVRYLHAMRHFNAAADSLATEAQEGLEGQAGRVVLSSERKAELKMINRIPEVLCTPNYSAITKEESDSEKPSVTAVPRGQLRRVHFEDELERNSAGDRVSSPEEGTERTSPEEPDFESNSDEFDRDNGRTTQGVETELRAESVEARTRDAKGVNPVEVQADVESTR
ncbi:hypothetical protein PI124_g19970 [Phytophthora idaei]|nr:hypothetical protein PI125_g20996 [Phytophthora idaei]KAG3132826.1 hypothetical protein PI126_g19461 [Phytophthora idaei]KAG3234987.1 hypothetical protein PI124_g19970 [Phytophthora idaei]